MVYSVFLRDVAPWVVYREAQAKRWSLTACPVDIWTELDSVNECVRAPVNNAVDIDTGTSGLPSPRINDSSNISISLLRDGADKRSKLLAGRPLCTTQIIQLSGEPIHVVGLFGLISGGSVCVCSVKHSILAVETTGTHCYIVPLTASFQH